MLEKIKGFYNEFRQAINFLLRFCVTFGVLSLIYGLYVESFGNTPDAITYNVATQLKGVMQLFWNVVTISPRPGDPSVDVFINGTYTISVFEGCNGIAIMNLFFSFLIGFWGPIKKLALFAVIGIVIIHLCNLIRLLWLGQMALINSGAFHNMHKYIFTLSIYVIVFVLWYVWITKVNPIKKPANGAA